MKLRNLIIPAIVLTVLGAAVKFCDTFLNVYGDGFFLSSRVCNFVFAGIFIILYIIGFALSMADRKKEFHAEPKKNFWCGAFGFVASVTLIGGGVIGLITLKGDNLFANLSEVAAGFVLLYEACISFTGQNGMKKLPVLALILPIWGCARFIVTFVEYSHYALGAREIFDIIEIGFMIMFLFYQSMFFAGINNKVAIRRSLVYGTVFMLLSLIVSVDLFIKMAMGGDSSSNIDRLIVEPTFTNIITYAGDLALCAYAFFFTREILATSEKNLVAVKDDGEEAPSPETEEQASEEASKTEAVNEAEPENVSDDGTETGFAPDDESKSEDGSEPEDNE